MSSNQSTDRHLEGHQLDAAAAYVKQFLVEQQQQPQQLQQHQTQPPGESRQHPMAAQYLNHYSGGGHSSAPAPLSVTQQQQQPAVGQGPVPAAAAATQQGFGRLVADYLQASHPGLDPAAAAAALPPSILASLQAHHHQAQQQQASSAPPPVQQHQQLHPHLHQQQQAQQLHQPHATAAPSLAQAPSIPLATSTAQQQLLASAQLLSSVNPGLAAAAMAQAISMANASNQPPPPPQPQTNNSTSPAVHHHHHLANASQQPQGNHVVHHGAHNSVPMPAPAGAPGQASLYSPSVTSPPVPHSRPSSSQPSHHHTHLTMPSVQQQQQQLPQAVAAPPSRSMSAGAAAAQYRLQQPATHSNKSSPSMAPGPAQKRPSQIVPATSMTDQQQQPQDPPTSMVYHVSSGSSINTGNSQPKQQQQLTQALSAVTASTTSSSNSTKNASPNLTVATQQPLPKSSLASASASLPASFGAGGGMNIPASAAAIHHHRGHHNSSAAGAAVSAPAVSSNSGPPMAAPSKPMVPNVSITVMQRWSLEQLDAHIKQLKDANQAIPQAVNLLAADMRRKEEKRHAKRLANRRSACTSRARKKALIEEMTKDNARLRRQALILSYLPDPVVAISTEGVITFCSMQVERVLKHKVSGLIGVNIEEIMVPSSRESIRRLIRDLIIAEQRALSSSSVEDEGGENRSEAGNDAGNNEDGSEVAMMPHEVSEHSSEQSFPPLLEVKVKAGQTSTEVAAGEDVSDSSGDRLPSKKNGKQQDGPKKSDVTTPTEMSSLTHKNSSSFGPESGEDPPPAKKAKKSNTDKKGNGLGESDDSTSSENKASANLTKNVEMCKLNKDKDGAEQVRFAHKDDVMGASVTANNADAKLSSLMHHPKKNEETSANLPVAQKSGEQQQAVASIRRKHVLGPKLANGESSSSADSSLSKTKKRSGNSSSDSGYRESNESPEESNEYPEDSSSSSGASSDRSSSKKKRRRSRPLAPACNVRLIRNDLSTIWCELTSSIRTRPLNDVDKELNIVPPSQLKSGNQKSSNNVGSNESAVSSEGSSQEEKELLLCFRPIREGEKVGEELRFSPSKSSEKTATESSENQASSEEPNVSSTNSTSSKTGKKGSKRSASSTSADAQSSAETQAATPPPLPLMKKNRPPKKRKFEREQENSGRSDDTQVEEHDEKSAVESMMELAKKSL